MTMKKIMAGVLAVASVMAMSATAFAVEAPDKTKAISKPGTAEYEAGIGFLTAELDVELPGNMKAFLNPYGASVAVTEETTPTKLNSNIVSWAYEVVNNTEDFAIAIDVVDAVATPSTGVSIAASVAPTDTTKKAVVVLKSDADPSKLAYDSAADTTNKAGCVVFTTTKATQKKFASVPAKDATNGAGKTYIGITGALTSVDNVDWTEDDSITCTYTLKINPSAAGAGGGGGSTVTPGLTADLTQANFTGTGITAFAKGSAANEYTMTIDTTTNAGTAVVLNLTGLVDNSQTITSKTAAGSNATVGGMGMNVNITPANTGSETVTITLSDSKTIVIKLTLT